MAEPNSDIIEPEDSENVSPSAAAPASPDAGNADAEIPVPIVMEPAEIDERARVIEALNRSEELP